MAGFRDDSRAGSGVADSVSRARAARLIALLFAFAPMAASAAAGETGPMPDWTDRIDTMEEFRAFATLAPRTPLWDGQVNFVLPVEDDPDLAEIAFINGKRYALHPDFLRAVLPERYAQATGEELLAELFGPERKFFSGAMIRVEKQELWGFIIELYQEEPPLPRELLERIYGVASAHFTAGELSYCPLRRKDAEEARSWGDLPFPVSYHITDSFSSAHAFLPYVTGVCYGRVRIIETDVDPEGLAQGAFGWQDILILKEAPWDLETVVAGAVSGEPLPPLSHFALRLAVRGTPNAYLSEATDAFKEYEGDLVRLEIAPEDYRIQRVDDPGVAVAWWDEHRPTVAGIPDPDADAEEILPLEAIAELGPAAVRRYGSKAANLAVLRKILGPAYVVPGFGIPMALYFRFLAENEMAFLVDGALRTGSYRDYIEHLLSEPDFMTDGPRRRMILEVFRKYSRKHGSVSPLLVVEIRDEIARVFGPDTMVRFRSSSNAEDALEFSGAGIYDSTSVCALDQFDGDRDGPSRCDPDQEEERTIERGLEKVWASLWNFRAFEEREYCRVPHLGAGMGILVTPAFPHEAANGVATTGNPANLGDRRYMVAVQLGDASVVRPEPGVQPEVDLLAVAGGEVVGITRGRVSSLVGQGEYVLTDAQLRELGEVLARIDAEFPVDPLGYAREQVLLDVEFKFTQEGRLVFKQVRPVLVAGARRPQAPERLAIRIPRGASLCGHFVPGRSIRDERRLLSRLALRSGAWQPPPEPGTWPFAWVERLALRDPGIESDEAGPGQVDVELHAHGDETFQYRFRFRGSWRAGGVPVDLESQAFVFRVESGIPEVEEIELDDRLLTFGRPFEADVGDGQAGLVRYGSCECGSLPLYEIRLAFERGRAVLHVRQRRSVRPGDSGPTLPVHAVVELDGERFETTDYWDLVYAADPGNANEKYLVLFRGASWPAAGLLIEMRAPTRAQRAALVDEALEPIEELAIRESDVRILSLGPLFVRGDATADGRVDIADPIALLRYLFAGGDPPSCADAGDADDDGRLTISDAVGILRYLFGASTPLPAPGPESCGEDPTEDRLPACSYPAWVCR